jgi:5,10-methylenetetrahydromethanopterin reductase
MLEVWLGTFPLPGRAMALARMAEADGWDGIAFTDSQHLHGDVFAALALAAHGTQRLKLATAATNPATRHAAVVASAIATVQVESGGRAVLGIARGDSALAYLGRPPLGLSEFRQRLADIRAYLRGEAVMSNGFASPIQWLVHEAAHPVPIAVAATGPRVIEIGAELGDRLTFSVGADRERLARVVEHARTLRTRLGLPPQSLGAYVNAVAHPDIARARELVRGRLSVYARFSSMHGNALASVDARDRGEVEQLATAYDMRAHGVGAARHQAALTDDFVDRFGVVGPSEVVAERLRSLIELGLDHLIIVGHGRDVDPEVLAESSHRFGTEVIPALKQVR